MVVMDALPRTARQFFFWIAVAVLLLVGSFQLYLSQQYFREFDPPLCGNDTCTDEGARSGSLRQRPTLPVVTGMSAPQPPRTPPVPEHPDAAAEVAQHSSWGAAPPLISRQKLVVVVSSSPRSGSSFLGELMSSPKNAAYFFEPFWYKRNHTHLGNSSVHTDLFNLLTCRLDRLPEIFAKRKSPSFMWRKPRLPRRTRTITRSQLTSRCLNTTLRVIKTIRPRLAQVLPLLQLSQYAGLDVSIVHLVRDPRAIMNSLLNQAKMWPKRKLEAEHLCKDIREDVRASQNIAGGHFTTVRYEDLVSEPLEEARRLFDFLRLPLSTESESFITSHAQSLANQEKADSVRLRRSAGRGSTHSQRSRTPSPEAGSSADGRASSEMRTAVAEAEEQREDAAEPREGEGRDGRGPPGAAGEGPGDVAWRRGGVAQRRGCVAQRRTRETGVSQADGQYDCERRNTGRQKRSADEQRRNDRANQSGRLRTTSLNTANTTWWQGEELDSPPTNTRRHLLTARGSAVTAKRKPITPAKVEKRPKFRRLTLKEYQKIVKKQKAAKSAPQKLYFGTVRGTEFDRQHWIRELPPAEREKVERSCADVLLSLGYPLRYPEEDRTVQ